MIGNDWDEILKDEMNKDYFKELINFVNNEYKTKYIQKNVIFLMRSDLPVIKT